MTTNTKALQIASTFAAGTLSCAKAAEMAKAEYRTREKAKAGLLAAFAKQYKAPTLQDEQGNTVGFVPSKTKRGTYVGTGNAANQALKRLLAMAFGSKKRKDGGNKRYDAAKEAARIAKSHTKAQIAKLIDALKVELKA